MRYEKEEIKDGFFQLEIPWQHHTVPLIYLRPYAGTSTQEQIFLVLTDTHTTICYWSLSTCETINIVLAKFKLCWCISNQSQSCRS